MTEVTNVETDRLEEARRELWLRLMPGYDMTLINDLEAAVRAAVQDQPVSDAEVEAAAKAIYMRHAAFIGSKITYEQIAMQSYWRDQARAALRAARAVRESASRRTADPRRGAERGGD